MSTNEAGLTPEQEKKLEQVMKLLSLAEKNGNAAEAEAAAAKAQEFMEAYNLDMATVERRAAGDTGKREVAAVAGGQYAYQRDLWRSVAGLNFCSYFPGERSAVRSKRTRTGAGTLVDRPRYFSQKFHRVVGRVVNVVSTRNMAGYLEAAVERLCRERYPEQSQFFSRSAVSYRRGIAANIVTRLEERHHKKIDAEARARREAEARAAASGVASSTAVTLGSYVEDEKKANYDFENGPGAWDARVERRRKSAEYWAGVERKQAEWDAAHPEEVAKREKKARQQERARERATERRREAGIGPRGYGWGKSDNTDSQAYYAGYRKGEEVGLDLQAEQGAPRSRRIAGG